MNPRSIERTSEIACNLVMTTLSLMLIAGYVFLFHVFRADRQQGQLAPLEQQVADSSTADPTPAAEE